MCNEALSMEVELPSDTIEVLENVDCRNNCLEITKFLGFGWNSFLIFLEYKAVIVWISLWNAGFVGLSGTLDIFLLFT